MKVQVAKLGLMVSVFFLLAGPGGATATAESSSKTVKSGSACVVSERFELNGALTIEKGATVTAPDRYLLTMTVNGVETAIQPGSYTGDVVLTPTVKISKALYSLPAWALSKGVNTDYRTGLFVDGGKIVKESSVVSVLVGGTYDDHAASGVNITSNNKAFNGFLINGSDYRISKVRMAANGEGGNDFLGFGAGVAVTGKSNVDIDNFTFNGTGPIRHGIFAAG